MSFRKNWFSKLHPLLNGQPSTSLLSTRRTAFPPGARFPPEYADALPERFKRYPGYCPDRHGKQAPRKDIIQLHLKGRNLHHASFDRPPGPGQSAPGKAPRARSSRFIQKRPKQPGIIYCLSRRSEELAEKLRDAEHRRRSLPHAGMNADGARRSGGILLTTIHW